MASRSLAIQEHASAAERLWGIVPAGVGSRWRWSLLFPRRRAGAPAPLSTVLDRASALIDGSRLIVVVTRGHEHDANGPEGTQRLVQPAYRGSAAEVFLALAKIVSRDPSAIVAVLPADGIGQDEAEFFATVARAAAAVDALPDLPIVLGLSPPCARPPGWVLPGEMIAGLERFGVRAVRRFIRRPGFAEAVAFQAGGGLVSSGVVVARAETLLALGRRRLPDVLEALEPLETAFDRPEEPLLREAIYEAMPHADLSHALFAADEPLGVLAVPRTRTRVRPVASA